MATVKKSPKAKHLSPGDYKALMASLEHPPEPNSAQKKAARALKNSGIVWQE
jgi:uncharacterized protein (DUF1778 family)